MAPSYALEQDILTLDLPPGLSIADLKSLVTAETNLPQAHQHFYLNNRDVQGDHKTIEEVGILDGDMLAMFMQDPQPPQNTMGTQRRGQAQAQQPQQQRGTVSNDQAETTRLNLLGNPAQLAGVREKFPSLAAVINDSTRFREAYQEMINADQNHERERQEQMRLLNEDPFNIEAQRKIEEMIRQESVQENLHFAYEHNPEGTLIFARVIAKDVLC